MPYNTGLTDVEWALVADLFERDTGTRGTLPRYARRELVDTCCYVLRTGCAWRLLPTSFPPWQAVYKSFSRWVEAGIFEQLQDRLRKQWHLRMAAMLNLALRLLMHNRLVLCLKVVKAALMQEKDQRQKVPSDHRYLGRTCSHNDHSG